MKKGSSRKFGIVSDISGLQQGIIINNISFSSNADIAQARNENGQVIDIAIYNENYQVTIDGLYINHNIHIGSIITIDNKNYLITQMGKTESNTAFQTASINARYVPYCYYWPLSTVVSGSPRDAIYSETSGQPIPPAPTIMLSPIPNISWDFENIISGFIDLSNYATYNGYSTLTYTITETLPSGVTFNNGILFANKEQMTSDVDTTLTLNVSASDVLSTATEQFGFKVSNVIEPVPEPTIEISTISNISWDFENASTSAINFSSYVTYTGSSTLNYSISETLPSGVTFNNGILSADKSLMDTNVNTTLTLNVSASDVLSTATTQFSFNINNVIEPVDPADSLAFKAVNGSGAIQLNQFGSPSSITLQYTKNGSPWTTYNVGDTITLDQDDLIAFSGANDHFSKDFGDFYFFSMTGSIEASGNIQSLMDFSTSATDWCYFNLFYDCSSLKKAPDLSATTLASGCYYCMFQNCTSLTTIPQLPATELARGCYSNMYQGCTSLSTIPDYYLPAETLTMNCYQQMFKDCTSLTAIPQSLLIASTLTGWCYQGMFEGCTSLSVQPLLNATTLADCCYQGMFKGCTSLHQGPELMASSLVDGCYNEMFYGCSNLDWIMVNFTDWGTDNTEYTLNWLSGVAEQGTFLKPSGLASISGVSNIPQNWYVVNSQVDPPEPPTPPPTSAPVDPDDPNLPLTFMATEDNSAIKLSSVGSPRVYITQYSINSGAWASYVGQTIQLASGEIVQFSGTTNQGQFSKNVTNYHRFSMTGTIEAMGNIQSLINWSNSVPSACYINLFSGCTSLTRAPNLPATGLADSCYASMFNRCTNLTLTPDLPVTTLQHACYANMFAGCTSLTAVPNLPANILANNCYVGMFGGCTSISSVPSDYLPVTELTEYCYQGMFNNCTSLTAAPVLSSTTLAFACYWNMFKGCTSISSVPLDYLPATTLCGACYYRMFADCTSLTAAPNLPAVDSAYKDLPNQCYKEMFKGCSNLTQISVDFTKWYSGTYDRMVSKAQTENWVSGVALTGTFYKPSSLINQYGDSRIPSGWTVVDKT